MIDSNNGRSTRRQWLATCGLGVAALSGCSALEQRLDGSDQLAFEPEVLSDLGDVEAPSLPDVFPVEITASMVDRHRERTRELLEAVPERPDIPNEVMAAEFEHERQSTVDSINREGDDEPGLDRLAGWRHYRSEAANLRAAYRAATDEFTGEPITERRDRLRSDYFAFLEVWSYQGADPVSALVVHRAIEDLLSETKAGVEPWPTVPDDPRDAVFRVGDIVAGIERGRAALEDALAIQDRATAGGTETASHRVAVAGAADRLDRVFERSTHRMDGYLAAAAEPFDRDIEDTPANELYLELKHEVEHRSNAVERADMLDHDAGIVINAGTGLTTLEALESVADPIESGDYRPPPSPDAVRRERARAVKTLEHAWSHEPQALSRALAMPAFDAILDSGFAFGSGSPSRWDVYRAYAAYGLARHYATLVPAATEYIASTLRDASGG